MNDINTSNIDTTYQPLVINYNSVDEIPLEVTQEANKNYIYYTRKKRNELLYETDPYLLPDFPNMNEEKLNELKIYRQKLRDYMSEPTILNYNGFNIENITPFPIKPSFIN